MLFVTDSKELSLNYFNISRDAARFPPPAARKNTLG